MMIIHTKINQDADVDAHESSTGCAKLGWNEQSIFQLHPKWNITVSGRFKRNLHSAGNNTFSLGIQHQEHSDMAKSDDSETK